MTWLDGITDSMGMNLSKLSGRQWRTGRPGVLQSMGSQRVVMTQQVNNNCVSESEESFQQQLTLRQ